MSLNHSTPLSKLADQLRIRRSRLNKDDLIDATCTAAHKSLKTASNKLGGTTRFSIAMAQELQEIIGEAEDAGCENPFPDIQGLLKEWEVFYQVMNLVDEVAE
jgi:hypothetical protein